MYGDITPDYIIAIVMKYGRVSRQNQQEIQS